MIRIRSIIPSRWISHQVSVLLGDSEYLKSLSLLIRSRFRERDKIKQPPSQMNAANSFHDDEGFWRVDQPMGGEGKHSPRRLLQSLFLPGLWMLQVFLFMSVNRLKPLVGIDPRCSLPGLWMLLEFLFIVARGFEPFAGIGQQWAENTTPRPWSHLVPGFRGYSYSKFIAGGRNVSSIQEVVWSPVCGTTTRLTLGLRSISCVSGWRSILSMSARICLWKRNSKDKDFPLHWLGLTLPSFHLPWHRIPFSPNKLTSDDASKPNGKLI